MLNIDLTKKRIIKSPRLPFHSENLYLDEGE